MKRKSLISVGLVGQITVLIGFATLLPASAKAGTEKAAAAPPIAPILSGTAASAAVNIPRLRSTNLDECCDAIMNLGHKDAAEAIPDLIPLLGNEAPLPRRALMRLLASSTAEKTGSCDGQNTVGGQAAETLVRIGETSDALLAALKAKDWQTRANAARAIGGLKDDRGTDELMAMLGRADEHWKAKGNAALALGWMGDDLALKPLVAALKDANAPVRSAAAMALGHFHSPECLPPLIAIIKDKDPDVRRAAAGNLGYFTDSAAVEALIQSLHDQERTVREVSASALGRTKDERAVEPLIAALKDPYANVQINAARGLGEIRDETALFPLINLLKDSNDSVRAAAAGALGELKDNRAEPALLALVKDADPVRGLSLLRGLQALSSIGNPGAMTALKKYNRHEPDWETWWAQNKGTLLTQ
jgi:HEAT repeat protein